VVLQSSRERTWKIQDALAAEPALVNYHRLPSVRGDLLVKLGRHTEAIEELQRALAMTDNAREQNLL
jgi:predicted RNA polymerase sigma factor